MLLFSCSFKPNLQLVFLRRAQQNRDLPFWNDINLKPSNSVGVFFSRRKYRIGGSRMSSAMGRSWHRLAYLFMKYRHVFAASPVTSLSPTSLAVQAV
jgi:hypothetical protein